MKNKRARLTLEDGSEFCGVSFGAERTVIVELVFNTSMVGYQEILSDPSYTDQAVVMTYPLIGNYGINEEDFESVSPSISGMVVRDYNDEPSNFRSTQTLDQVMKQHGIAGISGVDTRKITRHIRKFGSCRAMITVLTEEELSLSEAVAEISRTDPDPKVVARVSTKEIYHAGDPEKAVYHVVAIDCGMKQNIVRMLCREGCALTVVPWNTDAETIRKFSPDGIFVSNGPGDPTDVTETIETVRALKGQFPIFGICLGHQIISLAYHAKTYKLKFGHRGGNHPVKNLLSGKIEITSQNHSYAVDEASIQGTGLEVTHRNLLDQTVEGVRCREDHVCSVQYHPESAPGPQDSGYLFDEFLQMMSDFREERKHA
ncbi:MAG: glutamine-hydrolyzing carbamoyl-phosphate synthase small subunit [Eubacteriales bacterium]|nr:glutamine-hydrolyzing carbamoyl-phosphate synthase small subunit [Eubacteriales bacterium]